MEIIFTKKDLNRSAINKRPRDIEIGDIFVHSTIIIYTADKISYCDQGNIIILKDRSFY